MMHTDLLPASRSMASHHTYATNWPSFTGTMARPSCPQNSRYSFHKVDLDPMVRVDHAKSLSNRRARAAPPVVIALPSNGNLVRAGSAVTGPRREVGSLRGAGDAKMDSVVVSLSKLLPGGSGRRCTLVLMSMAGWYHDCLGQSGIGRRAGALDTRSFLTTAAMSSTGGQSSCVSSRDQCDANSLWHWRRRKTGCYPSGRRGNESRGAIIPSTTKRRSVCITARSPGEK
jgi:hypothetical protein